jgi:uncharacterized RDD family membrane protein YckC
MPMENAGNIYVLVINGKPQGPYSIDELRSLGIKPGDFVKSAGMDDYKEAHEVAELRELFNFAKPHVSPQYFASFDQRLLASALDWFFVCGTFIILTFIAIVFVDETTRIVIAFSLLAIVPVAKLIYHIIMECSSKQATYGKQILRIKVCDMNGERISPGRSIGRNLAKIFSVLTAFMGYLMSFFNRKHQCLHDMIAGTLVVKDRLV